MYSQFFGLQTSPFGITPDTSFFYSGGEREALISAIAYGITHGDGIIKVVGEVGSGKTMLSRVLARQLPDNINLVFLLNPSLGASDLIFAIGHELGLQFERDCSKSHALQLVQNKLLTMHAAQQRIVVFIDEAQCMPLDTLEELRLLSNLETETDKLLQLVLFGQPELDEHLSQASVRQIKERIIHNFYLKPFTRNEVGEYLSFRLHKAGYNGSPIFTASALRLLTRFSSGLPRKLTILADKSLLAAFAAQSTVVKASHVRLAAKDSGQIQGRVRRKSMALIVTLFTLLVLASVFYTTSSSIPPFTWQKVKVSQKKVEDAVTLMANQPLAGAVSNENSNQYVSEDVTPQSEPQPAASVVTLKTLIQKTNHWLASTTGEVYTIQILSANIGDEEFLEQFLSNVAQEVGLDELYVHPVNVDEKAFIAVTLGSFSSRNQALTYLNSLPDFLLRYQPYIKNIRRFKSMQ